MVDRRISPPVSHYSEIVLQPENVITLDNGIDIHIVNKGDIAMTRLYLIREGGDIDYSTPNVTNVMMATINEATRNRGSMEIAELIDFCGARIGGDISHHFSSLEMLVINSKLSELLPVIIEMITEASFPDNAVDAATRRFAANSAIQHERVSYRAANRLQALLQGISHPASITVTPEQYSDVRREDVLMAYDLMRLAKLHVFIGGRLENSIIEDIVDKISGLSPAMTYPISIKPFIPEKPRREHVEMPESRQSAVAMGMPTIGRLHPDYIPLRLAIMALGGYFGSRLMSNIREEKGLTYGINAGLIGHHEGTYLEISAQCDSLYVDRVVEETIYELEQLAKNPPEGEELERLRLHAWTQLATISDSVFGTLEHYVTHLRVGTPEGYFNKQLEAISSLNSETIARVVKDYLPAEKLTIVTAGKSI